MNINYLSFSVALVAAASVVFGNNDASLFAKQELKIVSSPENGVQIQNQINAGPLVELPKKTETEKTIKSSGLKGRWIVREVSVDGKFSEAQIGQKAGDIIQIGGEDTLLVT